MKQTNLSAIPECLTGTFWNEDTQSFLDWLRERHNYTPITVKILCRQTGGDYNKVMAWFRYRYHVENDIKQQLINNNPFSNMEENQNC